MPDCNCFTPDYTRRDFLTRTTLGLGAVALGSLLHPASILPQRAAGPQLTGSGSGSDLPHFVPRVRRIIYLFQSGGPSQLELFDYKPLLRERNGEELPESVRRGQ